VETKKTTKLELVELIIGSITQATASPPAAAELGAPVFEVEGLSGESLVDVSFQARRGEILGLTGLVGSGFEEVLYLSFGARRADSGSVVIAGRRHDVRRLTPARALRAGLAFVPGDRQHEGAIAPLSTEDNVVSPVLKRHFRLLLLRRRALTRHARQLLKRFAVRPDNPRLPYGALSGGNQQRALLAKWLQLEPPVLLVHEPTQGVDVGARQQIFEVLRSAAADGAAIVCSSSDHEQLEAIADRVVVIARGRIAMELTGASVRRSEISAACMIA
jgi:ribose transport system ATP-binding protein